jgi:transglutaminase-like putative cysteine protease
VDQFLRSTEIIDWEHPAIIAHAMQLRGEVARPVSIARRCFEWVRDEIKHSGDFGLHPVTCAASEVLEKGSGYCYAKSHLLAALLRANGLPAGLCYQRLAQDEEGRQFCLHGFNAVLLPGVGWYRVDPRGNRAGIDAQFVPPIEQLAFAIKRPGEADLPEVWPDPLPVVVRTLRSYTTAHEVGDHLPDLELWTAEPALHPSAPAWPAVS